MEASVLYKATQDNYTTYKGYMFKMELEKDKIFSVKWLQRRNYFCYLKLW